MSANANEPWRHPISAYVAAAEVWTAAFPSLDAWLENRPAPLVEDLRPALANPRLLRGTSLLTRMQVHVATSVARKAGFDLATLSSVFGSAFGEMEIALMQIDMMMEGDGLVSPARFKNSVHNAGSGVFSIAAKNHGFTTAIAGGPHTIGDTLLEALGLLHEGHHEVLAIVADEPLPAPLNERLPFEGLGVGLALTKEAKGAIAKLGTLGFEADAEPSLPALSASYRRNPCAKALFLAEAIARGRFGRIDLGGGYSIDMAAP